MWPADSVYRRRGNKMLVSGLSSAVFLSLKIGGMATLINLTPALFIARILARYQFRGKTFLEGVVNLPLVMPPVTTGYLLLFLLGKKGLIGSPLYKVFGLRFAFTGAAAVIACMVVSFPLLVRSIRISLDMVDIRLEKAAMTLGASPRDVFFRVTLPLIFPGLLSGIILGFARSLGEFGATITFAGNIDGVTRTIPLAVYSQLQVPGGDKEAGLLVLVSISISFLAMFASTLISRKAEARREGAYGA